MDIIIEFSKYIPDQTMINNLINLNNLDQEYKKEENKNVKMFKLL